jgi:uncharacterized protein (DUF934 family)
MLKPDPIIPASPAPAPAPLILKDGALIADRFTRLANDEGLIDGPMIVDLARLEQASGANQPLGVALTNTDDVGQLAPYLPRLDVIVLHFPKFTDGRAYSQARLLRERMDYRGEIRATGQVLADQLAFMRRCGFDAFIMAKGDPLAAWQRAISTFSGVYQPATDPARPAFIRRREAKATKATKAKE